MRELTLNDIKKYLENDADVTVREDTLPVSRARDENTVKSRGIPLDMDAEQCARIIGSEGTIVVLYSLTTINDYSEGAPKKAYRLLYSTWS